MKRFARWLWRVLMAAAVLTAVGIIAYWLVLPVVVRSQIVSQLREAGLTGPGMTVRHATPRSLHLSGLHTPRVAGRDAESERAAGLRIGDLHVSYDLSSLTGRRLRAVEVSGARWTIVARDGAVDLGLATPAHSSGRRGFEALQDLPLEILRISSSTLVLVTPERTWRLPVSGTIQVRPDDRLNGSLRLEGLGQVLAIDATARSEGQRFSARIAAQLPAVVHPGEERAALTIGDLTLDGLSVDLTALYDTHADHRLRVHLKGAAASLRNSRAEIHATGVAVRAQARFDQDWTVEALALQTRSRELNIAQSSLRDVVVAADHRVDELAFRATAAGDGWELMELSGSAPPPAALLSGNTEIGIDLAWKVAGSPPASVMERFTRLGITTASTRVTMLEGNGRLAFTPAGPERMKSWTFEAPVLHLDATAEAVASGEADMRFEAARVRADLQLSAAINPSRAELQVAGPSVIVMDGVSSDDTHLGPIVGRLRTDQPAPLLVMHEGGSAGWRLSWGIDVEEPVSVMSSRVQGELGAVTMTGEICATPGSDRSIALAIEVADAAVAAPAAEIALREVAMSLPLAWGGDAPAAGAFEIGEIRWREQEIASVSGSLEIVNGALELEASAVLDSGVLLARGHLQSGAGGVRGRIDLSADPFRLETAETLARLWPAVEEWQLAGELALEGTIQFADGRMAPLIRISAEDVSVDRGDDGERGGIRLREVSGEVTIDSFDPLGTPLAQRLRIGRSQIGELEVVEAVVDFAVEDRESILVEHAYLNLGAFGVFNALAFRFNPTDPEIELELYGQDMQLAAWLPLLTDGKATGEGTLYGWLPMHIIPGREQQFTLGEGYLYAEPGTGSITVQDRAWVEQKLLQQMEGTESDETRRQVQDRIVKALTDLEYTMLRCDFIREEGEVMAKVVIKGKGRQGPDAQEIGSLTINVWEVNQIVEELLRLRSAMAGSE